MWNPRSSSLRSPWTDAPIMKVLIGCECSGTVLAAFLELGHDAWSCDLKPNENPRFANRHIIGDVRDVIKMDDWDLLMVAHPPCTRLCNSGVRWLHTPPPGRTKEDMWQELDEGAALFSECWNADIPYIAVENPVMHKHAKARIVNYEPFAQSVQPYQFGTDPDGPDAVSKRTCFWLKGLPKLVPTGNLTSGRNDIHNAPPGPERAAFRSRFFPGMSKAIAEQWGGYVEMQMAA